MTLDQKIADLHTALERVETQQSQILLMLNLYGLDDAVLKETKDRLDERFRHLQYKIAESSLMCASRAGA